MQYSEMQAGDKVEITDKRTVTISKVDDQENAYDEDGRIIYANPDNKGISLGSYGTREFGLIERPLPPLPTAPGSVVRVSSDMPRAAFWFLTEAAKGVREWVSDSGIRKTPGEFARFIQDYRSRRFEVIR